MDYYDFRIDGEPVGYFEVEEAGGNLYMNAAMIIDGRRHDNPFWVALEHGRPVRYRAGTMEWQKVPDGCYPSSAYPIVLRQRLSRYRSIDEGSGKIHDVEVQYEGDMAVETVDDAPIRRFRVRQGQVIWIWWGGQAESVLKANRAEAVAGTELE
jgi:hypothetical protein